MTEIFMDNSANFCVHDFTHLTVTGNKKLHHIVRGLATAYDHR